MIHTYILTYIHNYYIHTYIHTYFHAYIHTYIHTYKCFSKFINCTVESVDHSCSVSDSEDSASTVCIDILSKLVAQKNLIFQEIGSQKKPGLNQH